MQKVPIWSNKGRGTLLTIFRPPGYSNPPRLLYFTQIPNPPAY